MKGGRFLLPLLLALLALGPLALAQELPVCGQPGLPECKNEAGPVEKSPVVEEFAPGVPPPVPAGPQADPFDRIMSGLAIAVGGAADAVAQSFAAIGDAFATAGALGWAALVALGRGLVALVDGVVALFQAYVAWLIRLQPEGMHRMAYAGVASGATAVAAAGLQTGAWYGAKKLLPWASLIPGFSRITKDELLEHERRAALFELIKHNPGIRLSEIAKNLDLAWGTAIHHLRKLRADRLVTFKEVGAHKCYFVNGSGLSEAEMAAASHLKGGTPTAIAAWLEQHPNASLKELAQGVGISSPLAAFHVGKLARAGLLTKVRDGRSVRLMMATKAPTGVAPSVGGEAVAA